MKNNNYSMKTYGLKTILVVFILEIIILTGVIILKGIWEFSIIILIVDLLLFGIVKVDSNKLKVYSLSFLFKKNIFLHEELEEIIINGREGLTPGRLDLNFVLKDKKTFSGFFLMYPFERNKLVDLLRDYGLKIKI